MSDKICIFVCTEDLENQIGVKKKIEMQSDAIGKQGYKVIRLFCGENNIFEKIKKMSLHYYGVNCRNIRSEIDHLDISMVKVVYARYSMITVYGLLDIFRRLKEKNPTIKIILEYPTFPYEQECYTLKSKPMLYRDRLHRKHLKEYVDMAVTLSPDKEIYGIPAYEITNGTTVEKFSPHLKTSRDDGVVNLIAVAGISKWHGFDRVIEGLRQYYKTDREINVYFHIVGDGPYKSILEKQVQDCKLDEFVLFHGVKTGEDLQMVYNNADIAVGSLGLHRMYDFPHVSVLKTREYCSIGIPFITVGRDYIYKDNGFEFCTTVSDDDEPISIPEIINFYQVIKNRYTDEQITILIRKFAFKNLEWKNVYKKIFDELKKRYSEWEK